ncbi:MAG TPA: TMEM175 family protein [Candidatus Sulfotelmatobacter sp.]|jgi:uncharacterized membrane protein|nr:TMEM175 family protein [Candidatus Sulfotelmatobacter sp.]
MRNLDKDTHDDADLNMVEGLSTSRIETLGDGVFAIAMTLLVLNLETPGNLKAEHLLTILLNLWPQLIAYFLSFIALGSLWVAHHNQYHWIQFSNRKFLWINIFFLSFVALIPFSTILLQTHQNQQLAVFEYGTNFIICLVLLYFHWWYATHKHRLIAENLKHRVIRLVKIRLLFSIVMYLIGILLSYFSPAVSLIIFVIIQLLSVIPSYYDNFFAARIKV